MITLHIEVKPGASKDELKMDDQGNFLARIRAKPIQGQANEYLINYLAEELGIRKSNIQLEKGSTSRFKKLSINITRLEFEEVVKRYGENQK